MKICVLKCDNAPDKTIEKFGDYDKIYNTFLNIDNETKTITFECHKNKFPQKELINKNSEINGFIITGSKHSSYDNFEWIKRLKNLIIDIDNLKLKMVGICFGHQIIADALGGKVIINPNGWNIGVHKIYINKNYKKKLDKLFDYNDVLYMQYIHKDIVSDVGKSNLEIFAYSNKIKNMGMIKKNHILTFQGHPEYLPDMVKNLYMQRLNIIPPNIIKNVEKNLNNPIDRNVLSKGIIKFYKK